MAYSREIQQAVYAAYVYDRLPLQQAATRSGVAFETACRWRNKAKNGPTDWDKARGVHALSDQSFDQLGRVLLHDYLLQHQAVMDTLKNSPDMPPLERVAAITSLADAFNKTLHSLKKLLPDLDEAATATGIIDQLRQFTQAEFPDDLIRIMAILEAFGPHLAEWLEARAKGGRRG